MEEKNNLNRTRSLEVRSILLKIIHQIDNALQTVVTRSEMIATCVLKLVFHYRFFFIYPSFCLKRDVFIFQGERNEALVDQESRKVW